MESQRKQSTLLIIVGIATLLVAIVGATFAYFSIVVSGNETASSIVVRTEILGSVTFLDGTNIDVTKVYPGWSATKNFVIENTTSGATGEISYAIILDVSTNTITDNASGAFVYSLSGTSDNGGTTISVSNAVVPNVDETNNGGILNGTDTHTYTFNIVLNETSTDQNAAQGRAFAGVLQVKLADGSGKRTWDSASSSWKLYEE